MPAPYACACVALPCAGGKQSRTTPPRPAEDAVEVLREFCYTALVDKTQGVSAKGYIRWGRREGCAGAEGACTVVSCPSPAPALLRAHTCSLACALELVANSSVLPPLRPAPPPLQSSTAAAVPQGRRGPAGPQLRPAAHPVPPPASGAAQGADAVRLVHPRAHP